MIRLTVWQLCGSESGTRINSPTFLRISAINVAINAIHIFATSICKSFVVKFVDILTFSLTIYQTQNKCIFYKKDIFIAKKKRVIMCYILFRKMLEILQNLLQ